MSQLTAKAHATFRTQRVHVAESYRLGPLSNRVGAALRPEHML